MLFPTDLPNYTLEQLEYFLNVYQNSSPEEQKVAVLHGIDLMNELTFRYMYRKGRPKLEQKLQMQVTKQLKAFAEQGEPYRRGEVGRILTQAQRLYQDSQYDEALLCLQDIVKKMPLGFDSDYSARFHMLMANIYHRVYDYWRALHYLMLAKNIVQKERFHRWETLVSNQLAVINRHLKRYDTALDIYKEQLEHCEARQDHYNKATTFHNIALVYKDLQNPAIALDYVQKALVLSQRHHHHHLHYNHLLLGVKLACEHKQEGAQAYQVYTRLQQANAILEAYPEQIPVSQKVTLHQLRAKIASPKEAITHLTQALKMAQEHQLNTRCLHKHLGEVYAQCGEYEKAYWHQKYYQELLSEYDNISFAQRVKVYRTLQDFTYLEMLDRLAIIAEKRDAETYDHTFRVGAMSALIAKEIGMPLEDAQLLESAARLHDIGKIAIPDAILLKPGLLTAKERRVMETHTLEGAEILRGSQSQLLRMAETIALTHHERWDGKGYPQGLQGEEIPLTGRIVAVADVLDALLSRRPYKEPWSFAEAVVELENCGYSQFDPEVVKALKAVLEGHAHPYTEQMKLLEETQGAKEFDSALMISHHPLVYNVLEESNKVLDSNLSEEPDDILVHDLLEERDHAFKAQLDLIFSIL